MAIDRRNFVVGAVGALGVPSIINQASAQTGAGYPNRMVKIVVPFTPGNPIDVLLRQVASRLSDVFKQAVIVENKPGAGANIGIDFVARSPADGYTVLCTSTNFVANPSLYAKVNYDPLKDFAAITGLIKTPSVLLVTADSPLQSVEQLIAVAKADPMALKYASGGNGTLANFSGELFKTTANIQALHVPYNGIPEILTSLLSKVTDYGFPVVASTLSQIKSGKFRALALTSASRMSQLPDVPTMHEAMKGGGFDIDSENGLAVPAGTPSEAIQRLHQEITKIMRDPAVATPLLNLGYEIVASSPDVARAKLVSDVGRFSDLARKLNLKIN